MHFMPEIAPEALKKKDFPGKDTPGTHVERELCPLPTKLLIAISPPLAQILKETLTCLIPRLHLAFQCCMLTSRRAWCAK